MEKCEYYNDCELRKCINCNICNMRIRRKEQANCYFNNERGN